jgi:hypothetical protein
MLKGTISIIRRSFFFKLVLKKVKYYKFVFERKKFVSTKVMDDLFKKIYYVIFADDFILSFFELCKKVMEIFNKITNKFC